jgi:hypothetical protein
MKCRAAIKSILLLLEIYKAETRLYADIETFRYIKLFVRDKYMFFIYTSTLLVSFNYICSAKKNIEK